ncbi:hypothetical protein BJ741DRAFT_620044 [Chytriomyces cf. hyalinus JEL632]|nr:hypothetical protein BJ741DRAFT_620044 [Chytriomyces cf. hyalinus JEL632]
MSHHQINNKRDSNKLNELLEQLDETLTAFAPSLTHVQEVDDSYDDLLNDYAVEPTDTAMYHSVTDSVSIASHPTTSQHHDQTIQATVSLLHQQMQQSKSPILTRNSIAATWDKPDKQQLEISNSTNRISSASSPTASAADSRTRYAYAPIMSPELHSLRVQLENAKKELSNQQNANRTLLKQQEAASFARYTLNQTQQPPLPFGSPSSLDNTHTTPITTIESTSLPSSSVLPRSSSPLGSRQSIASIASVTSDSKSIGIGMSSVGRSKSTASVVSVGKKKSKNAALLRMQLSAAGV